MTPNRHYSTYRHEQRGPAPKASNDMHPQPRNGEPTPSRATGPASCFDSGVFDRPTALSASADGSMQPPLLHGHWAASLAIALARAAASPCRMRLTSSGHSTMTYRAWLRPIRLLCRSFMGNCMHVRASPTLVLLASGRYRCGSIPLKTVPPRAVLRYVTHTRISFLPLHTAHFSLPHWAQLPPLGAFRPLRSLLRALPASTACSQIKSASRSIWTCTAMSRPSLRQLRPEVPGNTSGAPFHPADLVYTVCSDEFETDFGTSGPSQRPPELFLLCIAI